VHPLEVPTFLVQGGEQLNAPGGASPPWSNDGEQVKQDAEKASIVRRIGNRHGFAIVGTVAIIAASFLTLRLILVVAATPAELWLERYVPVAGPGNPPADLSPGWLHDPAIVRTELAECQAGARNRGTAACLAAVDHGLTLQPLSSELWLERARILVALGTMDDELVAALARSYATGPREDWIAATRLPFALTLLAFLPDEMIADLGRDVETVVANRAAAGPLISAFIADPFLRQASWDVISQYATFDEQERLIAWIRGEI